MSHLDFSSRSNKKALSRGFTLVELLVSCAIMVIITALVLVRFDRFDSTILLKNTAYDIALAIREAQIKSVSAVRGNSTLADYPYGVTFTPGTASAGGKEYLLFRFKSATVGPKYDVSTNPSTLASGISTSTISRSMYISDVCLILKDSSGNVTDDCTISRLDASFRRPEFNALIYGEGYSGNVNNIIGAKIITTSSKGTEFFVTKISSLGQVSVFKQP